MPQFILFSVLGVVLLCAFLPSTNSGVPQSRYEAMMKRESDTPGLYNETDKVFILTGSNFKESVIDQNFASLVEFYNSYCGHCRRFAPIYKDLAESVWPWRDVIKVMAVDCAADENNDVCREYEVMAYPTMRFFPPKYQFSENNYGTPITTQNPDGIREALVNLAANVTAPNVTWPNFSDLTEEESKALFEGLPPQVKYVVLALSSKNDSSVAGQTILNLSRYPELRVRLVSDEKLAAQFQLSSNNRLVAVDRNNNKEVISAADATPNDYKEALEKFSRSRHVTEKPEEPTAKPVASQDLMHLEEETRENKEILDEVKRNKHFVYQADLEQAIRHILKTEIPRVSDISGERLLALQRIVNVFQRYNPLGPNGRVFIDRLQEYVSLNNKAISGKDFGDRVEQMEQQLAPVFSASRYVGCAGSKPGLRGFTCSVWKLFHFLTVQAAVSERSTDPLEVLQALHGFVKNFFGCTDCSEHFQEMAKLRKIWNTPTKNQAVLWLWEAHNVVNNRLAGDETEDPQFPKQQFPTEDSCKQCHNVDSLSMEDKKDGWNREAVLQFLKNINNPNYISRFGLDDPDVLQPSIEKLRQKRMIGNVFSDMDMRMGMLLYGFCIIMMIVAFKLFAFKGYRKKPYGHEFLGKV